MLIGNEDNAKNAAKRCIYISLICGIIASILILIFSNYIIHTFLHDKINKSILFLVSIALPFISMSASINGYFTAVRKAYKTASGQFIEQATKILVTAYLINLFLPKGLDYACFSLILGDVISEIVSFIYIYILYIHDKRKSKLYLTRNKNTNFDKRIFKISIPIAITSYIRSGLSTLKQLLIPNSLEKSGLSCDLALSFYGLISGMAMPIVNFPSLFLTSFSSLLVPEFARYKTKKDYKRLKQVTKYILFITSILSIFLFLLLFILAEKISILFYKNIEIAFYIKILSPLVLFMYLDIVVDSILKGLDKQVSVMFINIIDLVTSLIFIYFFVPSLGTKGYIYSIYISEILNFVLSFYILYREFKTKKKATYLLLF